VIKTRFLLVFGLEPWLLPPAIEFTTSLNQLGYTTKLLYIGLEGNKGDLPNELNFECVFRGKGIWQRLRDQSTLSAKISKEKFDYVIACDLVALQSVFFSNIPKKKVIFWAFEVYEKPKKLQFSFDFLRLLNLGLLVRGIQCIIFPSASRRDRFIKEYRSTTPTQVIYNTRCVSGSRLNLKKYEAEKPGSCATIKIVYSGRFSPSQFADEILESSRFLPEGYKLIICGIASPSYIEKMRFIPQVEYLGRLDLHSMTELLINCDIGLCLYNRALSIENYDPAPNKVSDYIASGLRILSTDQSYLKQIVKDNKIGIDITDVTPSAITESIVAISHSDGLLSKEEIISFHREKFNMNIETINFLDRLKAHK